MIEAMPAIIECSEKAALVRARGAEDDLDAGADLCCVIDVPDLEVECVMQHMKVVKTIEAMGTIIGCGEKAALVQGSGAEEVINNSPDDRSCLDEHPWII